MGVKLFCSFCGTTTASGSNFCSNCGGSTSSNIDNWAASQPIFDFRRHFMMTFILAGLTAFFWVTQSLFPYNAYGSLMLFGPLPGLLSLVARASFIVSFIIKSKNWLAVSAISSTTSLVLGFLDSTFYGFYQYLHWPLFFTTIFSLSTLITYFYQAKSAGYRPYIIERKQKPW